MTYHTRNRLLVCAQAVDRDDPALGFFILWLRELAPHFESVTVLALRVGAYELPANIRVEHLGAVRARRLLRLVRRSLALRRTYDAVFVHQGQEFVLGAGWLWKLLGKPVYLWRNHYQGSWLTSLAVSFCRAVFYTSDASYTARYRRAIRMPVGVDLSKFSPAGEPAPHSVLSLGRISPSKRIDSLIDALGALAKEAVPFSASIYGAALPHDRGYEASLKAQVRELGIEARVRFGGAVRNEDAPDVYRSHEVFVNLSPSGMYDKTVFEAAACGCLVLTSMGDFARDAGPEFVTSPADAAAALKATLALPDSEKARRRAILKETAQRHSLASVAAQLAAILTAL